MKFSKQAQKAIKMVNNGEHLFITGKAGTGKSTLLEHLRKKANRQTVVLAPTGIAAINVQGDTIHSFFSLKPGFEKDEAENGRLSEHRKKRYQNLKTILIDEISMVRADLLDAIDIFLRRARNDHNPFGGVQMIFFGDLYQLPPVITTADREKFYSEYTSPYFFDAQVFHNKNNLFADIFSLKIIELDKIYRQKDENFINILNAVRHREIAAEQLHQLNTRWNRDFIPEDEEKYIHLMCTNADARQINMGKLDQIDEEEVSFTAEITGKIARNLHPNDEEITVKIGSQIMFIHNDPERRWVNGTIGKIVDIEDSILFIEKDNGQIVETTYHTWEISHYVFKKGKFEREIIGSFKQVPLKLAWAITIHKSQGKSFDKVIIDLGRGSFAHGQTYVALSRCTSLEGLILKQQITPRQIIMDPRVQKFDN